MPDLKSNAWGEYSHAYGVATDIPDLLVQLSCYPEKTDHNSEPFFSLWSALCHQGDTYTAAYAAVPHILELATREPSKITSDFLLLPTSIEIARLDSRGPAIPDELVDDYVRTIQSMPNVIGDLHPSTFDETWSLTCASALAVSAGHGTLAEAILELEGEVAQKFLDWKADL
jgi:hypothetical protein